MFNSHEISPNTHDIAQPQAAKFTRSYYLSPSFTASPLTLFDAHEMADLIRRTITRIDVAIAADIAAHMDPETTNMSGRDFLNLSPIGLQTLSKNNEQVFRGLRQLQQIPHDAMTFVSTRSPSIEKGFPELASLIHNRRLPSGPDGGANSTGVRNMMNYPHNGSSSSAMLGPQFSEESFNHEAFNYSDDEDEVASDLHSTVAIINEGPTTERPLRSSSDPFEGSQLENSLTLSLEQPQPLINSHAPIAEDKEPPEPPHLPASEPVAILSAPPSSVVCNPLDPPPFSEFLYVPDLKPYNPINDTCFDVGEASKGQTYETPQISDTFKEEVDRAVNETDSDSPRYLNINFENLHDSLTSNGTHGSIESCRSFPQPFPSSLTNFLELTSILSFTGPHSINAGIQSVATSTDEILEDPVVDVSSNMSPLGHPSNLPRLEVHHDLDFDALPQSDLNEQSNVDMNITATSSHGITLPFDTLPLIPVTPSSSPVFEGLSKYMAFYESNAPGVQREISAREHTVCPPLEAPRIELLSSTSGNGQSLRNGYLQLGSNSSDESKETPGSDVDITTSIQPDLFCLHPSSPYQRMQLGVLIYLFFFMFCYFLVYSPM